MAVDHAQLKMNWQLMKNATANHLYAGLAALAGELYQYLSSKNEISTSAEHFQKVYQESLHSSPGSGKQKVQTGKAFHFRISLEENASDEQIAEGRLLFTAFSSEFKPTICSQKGVMGLLLKGTVNTEEMPVMIATHILNNHLSEEEHWNDFALLIGTLIDRLGMETFCVEGT